jgi:hypothetical protein
VRPRLEWQGCTIVAQSRTKSQAAEPTADPRVEEGVAYLSKRHRVSPAIVREIIRRIGTSERSAVEREIRRGLARR